MRDVVRTHGKKKVEFCHRRSLVPRFELY